MVGSLIYYKDTHEFFDKHYNEIEDIRMELQEDGVLEKLPKGNDLKNFMAWMSFEHRASELYNELEMEGR